MVLPSATCILAGEGGVAHNGHVNFSRRVFTHQSVSITSPGEVDTIVTGMPSSPRLVTAVDPRLSDTRTTAVTLNMCSAVPGGI